MSEKIINATDLMDLDVNGQIAENFLLQVDREPEIRGKTVRTGFVIQRQNDLTASTLEGMFNRARISVEDIASEDDELFQKRLEMTRLLAETEFAEVQRRAAKIQLRLLQLGAYTALESYRAWTPPAFDRTLKVTHDAYGHNTRKYECSNAVYRLDASIDHEHWGKISHRVRYDVWLQPTLASKGINVAAQDRTFSTAEAAEKYLEGRLERFQKKYFSEDYPPIPEEHANHFMYAGMLLPGYYTEAQRCPHIIETSQGNGGEVL